MEQSFEALTCRIKGQIIVRRGAEGMLLLHAFAKRDGENARGPNVCVARD